MTPAGGGFPSTHWSAVQGARSTDPAERARSFEAIVAAYWRPVYKFVRMRWSKPAADAEDLTQEFFARALEKGWFSGYDPARGRFRAFLRICLDGFLSNEDKAARRLKRGGDAVIMPLQFETAEGELRAADLPAPDDLDRYFDAEWVRSLFGLALEALRADLKRRGKEVALRFFERYDLEDAGSGRLTYADLAVETGLPVTQVTNHLAFARREFRRLLLETLREVTGTEEEFHREARFLLGGDEGTRRAR